MPGRASSRSARSSSATVGRKSSTATLKSTRGSASARTSAYAVEVPDEGPSTSLRTQICQVFAEAQRTTATQRKLVVTLRKIQEACCYEPQNTKKKQTEDFDEEAFNEEVGRCIMRILAVKKSEPVGDRIIRFLGIFLKRAADEDKAAIEVDDDATAVPETPTSRLTTHILSILLQVLSAKDKTVRFRATQSIAHIVNSLDSIDDEMFHLIRLALQKRLRDKESSVRVQAVLGLGPLAGNGDEESDEEDSDDDDTAGGILFKLLDIMQNDPSADVRRTVLMNLPFQPITIKYLLERARDIDPATRRALYGKLLPVLGDFRHMSLVEREKLIRWGLRDRDEGVRKAAANLFRERWIEDCAKTASTATEEEMKPGEAAAPNLEALLELLERIDVTHSGVEEGIAHQAMKEFWAGRPDYIKHITFDDDFWNDLTPESAFTVRSLNDYSLQADDDRISGVVEEKMPEVTKIAFFIQQNLNRLIEGRNKIATLGDDVPADIEEAYEAQEFIVEQLLHIATTLDYTDEVGRRQIFTIMREALSFAELPEECTKLAVEVLRTVCGSRESGEREFCSVVLEAVAEVRDTLLPDDATEKGEDADESFHSAQSDISDLSNVVVKQKTNKNNVELDPAAEEEKRVQEVFVYAKCLHIAECMLQNIHSELEANSALVTVLNTLIVPACRSHEAWIREMGLKCLGLCALLSKDLATNNFELFLHCFAQGHDSLQMIAIQVLTDVIITHPSLLAPVPADLETAASSDVSPTPSPFLKPVTKTFLKAFNSSAAELSQTACTAASKLLLLNILPQNSAADILKTFTLAYFNPETAANPALRQALSYFLPVFCHSRQKNAALMGQIVVSILQKLMLMRDDLDEEAEDMVSWAVVAGHLSEWTDGRRVVGATELGLDGKTNTLEGAEEPHILLAIELLERALKDNCTKEEKKPLLTLLSKLHIASSPTSKNESVDEETLRTVHALASEAVEAKLGPDATTRNYISKLEIALTKRLGDVEHVTQLPADDETITPDATELPTAVAPAEGEEDTMMADPQAEGTRMPLEDEDEEEGDTTTVAIGRDEAPRAITESDIVDSLLDSEM